MKKVMFVIWVFINLISLGLLIASIIVLLTGDMSNVEEVRTSGLIFLILLGILGLSVSTLTGLADDKSLD